MLKNKPKRPSLPTIKKLSPEGKKGLEIYLRKIGQIQGKPTDKEIEKEIKKWENQEEQQEKDLADLQFAKNLVHHLQKIGQIPGKTSDKEIEKKFWEMKK